MSRINTSDTFTAKVRMKNKLTRELEELLFGLPPGAKKRADELAAQFQQNGSRPTELTYEDVQVIVTEWLHLRKNQP